MRNILAIIGIVVLSGCAPAQDSMISISYVVYSTPYKFRGDDVDRLIEWQHDIKDIRPVRTEGCLTADGVMFIGDSQFINSSFDHKFVEKSADFGLHFSRIGNITQVPQDSMIDVLRGCLNYSATEGDPNSIHYKVENRHRELFEDLLKYQADLLFQPSFFHLSNDNVTIQFERGEVLGPVPEMVMVRSLAQSGFSMEIQRSSETESSNSN